MAPPSPPTNASVISRSSSQTRVRQNLSPSSSHLNKRIAPTTDTGSRTSPPPLSPFPWEPSQASRSLSSPSLSPRELQRAPSRYRGRSQTLQRPASHSHHHRPPTPIPSMKPRLAISLPLEHPKTPPPHQSISSVQKQEWGFPPLERQQTWFGSAATSPASSTRSYDFEPSIITQPVNGSSDKKEWPLKDHIPMRDSAVVIPELLRKRVEIEGLGAISRLRLSTTPEHSRNEGSVELQKLTERPQTGNGEDRKGKGKEKMDKGLETTSDHTRSKDSSVKPEEIAKQLQAQNGEDGNGKAKYNTDMHMHMNKDLSGKNKPSLKNLFGSVHPRTPGLRRKITQLFRPGSSHTSRSSSRSTATPESSVKGFEKISGARLTSSGRGFVCAGALPDSTVTGPGAAAGASASAGMAAEGKAKVKAEVEGKRAVDGTEQEGDAGNAGSVGVRRRNAIKRSKKREGEGWPSWMGNGGGK
ncbi:hypothetical protein MMC10_007113 [Thelotrema lepadinum]|nr:hypothetical protein [Thelotrema lepadinum]